MGVPWKEEVGSVEPKEKEKRSPTALRLPDSLRLRVSHVAEERGTSTNHLVIKALELYLEALPPIDVSVEELRGRIKSA